MWALPLKMLKVIRSYVQSRSNALATLRTTVGSRKLTPMRNTSSPITTMIRKSLIRCGQLRRFLALAGLGGSVGDGGGTASLITAPLRLDCLVDRGPPSLGVGERIEAGRRF